MPYKLKDIDIAPEKDRAIYIDRNRRLKKVNGCKITRPELIRLARKLITEIAKGAK